MRKGKRIWSMLLAFTIGFGTLFVGENAAHANYVEVWTESSYVNVFRHTIRTPDSGNSIKLSAAKNEYEAAQILIRRDSAFTINGVTFTNLTSGGNSIASSNLKFQYVEYEYLNFNSQNMDNVVRRGAGHYPESLSNNPTIAVAANSTQPIWIRAYIPKNAAAGVYTGTATVQTSLGSFPVSMTVDVKNVTIPDTEDGAFTNAQWMQFYGSDSTNVTTGDNLHNAYGYPRLSADWWTLMENFAENAKNYRTNSIPVNYVYMLLDGGSTVDANGVYTFNWSVFDQVIQFFIDKGVVKRLEGFTTGIIIDRDANGNPYRNWILGTPNDPKLVNWINQFFPALKAHLESKTLPDGRTWADIWWQHVRDEPSNQAIVDEYLNLANQVRAHWPDIKFGDAINRPFHTQLAGYVSVWVPQSDLFDNNQAFFKARQAAPYNEEVWTYTCAEPRGMYLNRFIDQPVWMNRAMSWYAYRTGTTGYLHYGYNHWDLTMNNQAMKGDLHLVQPDVPNKKLKNSIRLEAQRDGIEDYELLKILEATSPETANGIAASLVTNGTVYSRDIGQMIRMRELLLSAAAGEAVASIAAGKTATASSQQTGSEASKAVDGNTATKWQSSAAGSQWISVDLGAQYQIDGVKIKWGTPYATSYKIQTSYNGTNWADAATITGGNGGDDYSAIHAKGRYLRINATAGSGSSYAMFSLEAAGRALLKTNLAGGKTYVKSETPHATYTDQNNGESTDGIASTNYMDFRNYGYTGTNGQTKSVDVTVDLGSVQWVKEVKIRRLEETNIHYSPDSVEILTSKDNVNFTPGGKITYATSTDGLWYEFTIFDTSARYVKVNFKKTLNTAAFADWMFIDEIEIYGPAATPPPANLALGKTYVKSEQPLTAYPDTNGSESTDGILSGNYAADGKSYGYSVPVGTTKTVTVTLDLGSDQTVNLVKLRRFEAGGSGYGPDNVVVSTSTNAAPNTFVTRGETSWYNGWWYDVSFSNATARYVRLAITKTGVSGADHLFLDEIGVFGTEPAATNLAAGLTYTKSAAPDTTYPDTGNLEATNGVLAGAYTDGKSFGYSLTSGQTRTVSFVFDLGSAKTLNLVKLLAYNGSTHNYKPDSVAVATSLDNITYTSKGTVSTPVNNWFSASFANTSARYVKVTVSKTYGATLSDWMFLDEIEIYGY